MEEVNNLEFEDFMEKFGNVIERTPMVTAIVWTYRPFPDFQALHEAFCQFLRSLAAEAKAGMLRCLPDIGGRLGRNNSLSIESMKEQGGAGMLHLNPTEAEELERLHVSYWDRFGIPFVVCTRENKKETVFSGIRRRLGNSLPEEVETGVSEICKVARHRLVDMVSGAGVLRAKL